MNLILAAAAEPTVSLSAQTRVIAALIAIGFMVFILDLIRRGRLQERYSVIWFLAGLALLAGAAFPGLLEVLASALGVRDTNAALFTLLILFLLALAVNFSVIISGQAKQITRLAQENAIAKADREYPGGPGAGGSRESGDDGAAE